MLWAALTHRDAFKITQTGLGKTKSINFPKEHFVWRRLQFQEASDGTSVMKTRSTIVDNLMMILMYGTYLGVKQNLYSALDRYCLLSLTLSVMAWIIERISVAQESAGLINVQQEIHTVTLGISTINALWYSDSIGRRGSTSELKSLHAPRRDITTWPPGMPAVRLPHHIKLAPYAGVIVNKYHNKIITLLMHYSNFS